MDRDAGVRTIPQAGLRPGRSGGCGSAAGHRRFSERLGSWLNRLLRKPRIAAVPPGRPTTPEDRRDRAGRRGPEQGGILLQADRSVRSAAARGRAGRNSASDKHRGHPVQFPQDAAQTSLEAAVSECYRRMRSSLWIPGRSLIDRPQHSSELLDIIWWIAAVQHRVTVRADGDQISLRDHGIRGSHSVQRSLVVDVNEALAWVAVPLLKTQVAHRASQTVMMDAVVACLGITLVAIHRHSLDIPFVVAILHVQLADRCWLIGWGKARKGWTGKRRQSALGLVTLVLGE